MHVTHNEAIADLDILAQLVVEEIGTETPPPTPEEGAIYALGAAPTGDWSGHPRELAQWQGTTWRFAVPQQGWRAWDLGTSRHVFFDGQAWAEVTEDSDLQNLPGIGIGTQSDATNRLSVASQASLFSHDGSDHRIVVNKAGGGDTASLLYQSGWTGHAEMGLTGDTDFQVKVSADGSSWTDALTIDAANGLVTGAAVQSSATDTTEGKLLAVGAFGLGADDAMPVADDCNALTTTGFFSTTGATSNAAAAVESVLIVYRAGDAIAQQQIVGRTIWARESASAGVSWGPWAIVGPVLVGSVTQSEGIPTGAAIENGSNANGDYVRFADGTQFCWQNGLTFTEEFYGERLGGGNWVFPAAFADTPVVTASYSNSVGNHWIGTNTHRRVSAFGCGVSKTVATTMRIFAIDGLAFSDGAQATEVRVQAAGTWY